MFPAQNKRDSKQKDLLDLDKYFKSSKNVALEARL